MKNTGKILALAALGVMSAAVSVNADTVALWNFNGPSNTTVPGGANSPLTAIGSGVASLVGGATADAQFGSGASNGGSSDPAGTAPPNFGWQTTGYAAQGTQSGERGVQFNVSTLGYQDIFVSWDQRHSNTSSRFAQLQYSLDGINFSSIGLADNGIFEAITGGDTWYNQRTVDLSGILGAANNADFAVRIVAVFNPANGTSYAASSTASTYAGTGTWRFDMVTFTGTVIPGPGALALLGLAGMAAHPKRRRA